MKEYAYYDPESNLILIVGESESYLLEHLYRKATWLCNLTNTEYTGPFMLGEV